VLKATTPSIVIKRLWRNLQYRLTYSSVFETFTDPDPGPEVVTLLESLVETQQAAARLVSGYLDSLDVDMQGLGPKHRLFEQAAGHNKLRPRLEFIHSGLSRSASWYKVQLKDQQMTADPELRQLLLALGEMEARSLWRTEALMAIRGMLPDAEPEERPEPKSPGRDRRPGWRSRLAADVPRPSQEARRSEKRRRSSRPG
jgi:hypothetical protein